MKKYYKKGLGISLTTMLMLGTVSVNVVPFHIASYAKVYEENMFDIKMEDKTEKDIENSNILFNSEIVTMGTESDFEIDENGVLTWYDGNGGRVVIPEGVIGIGEYVFSDCSNLTKITFSENLASIGDGVFENCSGLKEVTLPEGVTSMGKDAFQRCSSLKEITLSKEFRAIEEVVFNGCTSLEKIVIPGNPNIAKGAFYDCREKLTIYCEPDSWAEEYAYFDDIPYHYIDHNSDLESSKNQSLVNNITPVTGEWIKDTIDWRYKNEDNSYSANKWQLINGKWYFFQKTEYMAVGWIYDNYKWYYLNEDGSVNYPSPKGNGLVTAQS